MSEAIAEPTPAPTEAVESPAAEQEQSLLDSLRARMNPTPEPEATPAPTPEPEAEAAPEPEPEVKAEPKKPDSDELEGEHADSEPDSDSLLPLGELDDKIEEPTEENPENVDVDTDTPSGRAWKAIRTDLKSAKTLLAERDSELQQIRTQLEERSAESPRLEELQAKLDAAEKRLQVADVTLSPAYIDAVEKPFQEVVSQSDELASKYEIDPNELSRAISEPDRKTRNAKIAALTADSGVDELDRLAILDLSRDVERLTAMDAKLRDEAGDAKKALEAAAERVKQDEILARADERKTKASTVLPQIASRLPSFKDEILAMSEHFSEVDPASEPVERQIYAATLAKLFPAQLKKTNALQRDYEAVLEELDALKASMPGAQPSGAPAKASPADDRESEGSLLDNLKNFQRR